MNSIVRIFSALTIVVTCAAPSTAQPSAEDHQRCLGAADYQGCVHSHSQKLDVTVRPGLLSEMGNSCPTGTAYAGSGKCRSVICQYQGIFGRNRPELAGKGHSCAGVLTPEMGALGTGSLTWGQQFTPASNNPRCPSVEPRIGDRDSCSRTF